MSAPILDPYWLRRVSVAADGTNETTIRRYLAGLKVQPSSARRIEAGLRALGLVQLIRPTSPMAISSIPHALASYALKGGPR